MTKCNITSIDGGSSEYWRKQTEAFRLIADAERAGKYMTTAPLYLHGGYDEDGDVIAIENLAPFDAMDEAIKAIEANEPAVSILVAQRRTEIAGCRISAVVRALRRVNGDGFGCGCVAGPEGELDGPDTD